MWRENIIRLIAGLLTVLLALSLAACSIQKKDEGTRTKYSVMMIDRSKVNLD